MPYDPKRHHRRSIRLKGHDYQADGVYFVTLCVQGRHCVLGEVRAGRVKLSPLGQVVAEAWQWLAENHPYVALDTWVVMPNHLHGILVLRPTDRVQEGGSRTAVPVKRKPLGRLIGAFKTISTKRINQLRNTEGERFWQRNYWERIIRDDDELHRTRWYIANNPAAWTDDALYVE